MLRRRTNHRELAFVRRLRVEATTAEEKRWSLLRNRRLAGAKFGRQANICGWIVDFACVSHQLVVELDGGVHDEVEQAASDAQRDRWLCDNGWKVLRFRNAQLLRSEAEVLTELTHALGALTPAAERRPLSPERGEG